MRKKREIQKLREEIRNQWTKASGRERDVLSGQLNIHNVRQHAIRLSPEEWAANKQFFIRVGKENDRAKQWKYKGTHFDAVISERSLRGMLYIKSADYMSELAMTFPSSCGR